VVVSYVISWRRRSRFVCLRCKLRTFAATRTTLDEVSRRPDLPIVSWSEHYRRRKMREDAVRQIRTLPHLFGDDARSLVNHAWDAEDTPMDFVLEMHL